MSGHFIDRKTVLIANAIALLLIVGSAYAALAALFGHALVYGATETLVMAGCIGFAGASLFVETLRMGFGR